MELGYHLEMVDDHPVVALQGTIDLSALPALRSHLTTALGRHPRQRVLVDLEEVPSMDDSGVGILLGLAAGARSRGGDVALVCSREALRARLVDMRVDRALDIYPSISTAIAAAASATSPTD